MCHSSTRSGSSRSSRSARAADRERPSVGTPVRADRLLTPAATAAATTLAAGIETDELARAHACAARLRLAHDALHELVRRRRVEVDDVRRDLHTASQPQPESLHAAEPAGRLPHRRGDLLGDVERPLAARR